MSPLTSAVEPPPSTASTVCRHVPRRNAVEGEADVIEAAAAHGEDAMQIVGRAHARQRLYRPQRIVEHDAAEVLKLSASQRLPGGDSRLARCRCVTRHGHVFAVRARAWRQRYRRFHGLPGHHLDLPRGQDVADDRDGHVVRARRHRRDGQPAGLVGDRRRLQLRNLDRGAGNRLSGLLIDDADADGARAGRILSGYVRCRPCAPHQRCNERPDENAHNDDSPTAGAGALACGFIVSAR